MNHFFALFANEWEKLRKRRRLFILGIIVVLFSAGITAATTLSSPAQPQHWQDQLHAQIQAQQKTIAEMQDALSNAPASAQAPIQSQIASAQATIEQLQYQLDHDIPPTNWYAASAATQVTTLNGIGLFVLLFAWLAAELIAQERADGTIKLLLSRPASRPTLLAAKFAALVAATIAALLLSWVATYLTAGLTQGHWGGFSSATLLVRDTTASLANNVVLLPIWQYSLVAMGVAMLLCLMAEGLGMLISSFTRGTGVAIGLTIGIFLVGEISWSILNGLSAAGMLYLPGWTHFLFVAHTSPVAELGNAQGGFASTTPSTRTGYDFAWQPTVTLAGWAILFLAAATAIFRRKDELA